MIRLRKILPLSAAALAVFMMAGAPAAAHAGEQEVIAEGVYIGSINVGGMTKDEASDVINDYVDSVNNAVITLAAGEKSIEAPASGLGVKFSDMNVVQEAMDVGRGGSLIKCYKDKKDLENGDKILPMPLEVDDSAVTDLLTGKANELNQEAVDNGLVRENGKFRFIEGAQGIEVNIPDSIAAIEEYISSSWDGTDAQVSLVAEIVEPRGTKEELSRIQDLLGSYNTNYSSSTANRCENISIAANMINGTVLYPGEEFSVYKAISPLDASGGYKLAGAYENGQTVESYGGGVCQVSTTLYNTVILSELEVTERSNHSMIVTYVKPSMDAAIAGDYKDLKFVNNQDSPIYIEGYTSGKNLYFNIFGEEKRPANRSISFESEVISSNDPGTQFVATGDPVGVMNVTQGKHTGYVARLWKIVTVDGVEESREIFNKSTYKASPKIVNVGTASEDPNLSAAVGAAIAAQDEAAINAAVAQATVDTTAPIDQEQPAEQPSSEEQGIIGSVDESQITDNPENPQQ